MRLKQIKLTNFRAIDDAIIEFDGKSTVIFGINGTGKSSILRSVNLLFANIINQVVNRKELKQNYAIQLEDIMYGKSGTSIHATIEFEVRSLNIQKIWCEVAEEKHITKKH